MELQRLQEHWNAFGEQDPLWAILSDPAKRGRGWEQDLDEFFASGQAEVDDVLRVLAGRGVTLQNDRALDFGCGVGRLTRALAERFHSADGIDVAASMIERARELNEDSERLRFHHNPAQDLRLFGDESFDFILSLIVLQHMEPGLMRGYMRDFVRVLRPRGVAFFSVPERFLLDEPLPPDGWRASLTLIGELPPLVAGRTSPLRIRVRNTSNVQWPSLARVKVANHWLDAKGKLVVRDDARTVIETAMDPGAECEVELAVLAPVWPGAYELEIDLLQEVISWFADRGSATLKLPVTVVPEPEPVDEGPPAKQGAPANDGTAANEPNAGRNARDGIAPRMEMYVMAREDVVATVEDAGGVVLDVIAKDRCGLSTPSLDYIVARATAPPRMVPRAQRPGGQDEIETQIRDGLQRSTRASRYPARRLAAADPARSRWNWLELSTMEGRADLVGFPLTSRMKRLGRASTEVRRALRRALFQVLDRQTQFNRAALELLRSHETQIATLGASVRAQIDIQAGADDRLDALVHRLPGGAGLTARESLSFRDRFHATSEERREQLTRFVSLFEGHPDVIDAGCGTGEFLTLLRDAGLAAVGVDSDKAMVDHCRQLGLDATDDEAVEFLRGRPEDSQGGIFAAGLIEHLQRGEVVELMRLAFSRLRPGGVLVLQTINPMCLTAYARFYGDFGQTEPVPALALRWLAESCGFTSVEVEYSSPVPAERKLTRLPASAGSEAEGEGFNRGLDAVNELLFGFQEYSLIARKPG
jgi:SAM-dependent methyltransferase